jgi:hypothetical protein
VERRLPNTGFPANSKAAERRETPVFDEHDQWLASCRRRFSETAPAHYARKAWQCRAYYDQAKYMPPKCLDAWRLHAKAG